MNKLSGLGITILSNLKMINKHYTKLIIFILSCVSFSLLFQLLTSNKPISPDLSLFQTQQLQNNKFIPSNPKAIRIITDFSVIKCHLYTKCNIPKSYIQLLPNLNYYHNSKIKNDYYLIVKYQSLDEATKVITDISTTKNDDSYEEIKIDDQLTLYKKVVISNTQQPVAQDLPILRSIDVLFGNNDLIDSRPYHNTLHLSNSDTIHTILSLNMMSLEQQAKAQESNNYLDNVKNSQLIETNNQRYKVMQLSDLHFGQDLGRCETVIGEKDEDNVDEEKCTSDLKTLKFIEDSINQEKPDLIVITGDLIDIHRSIDYKSILLKSLQPILANGIKFIYTFGDEIEHTATKLSVVAFLSTLPNCLNTVPQDNTLHGVSNYNFQIKNEKQSASITVLDSENHLLDDSQINYLYRINNEVSSDYKLLFFHYPIPQFRPKGKFKIVGSYNEKHALDTTTNVKFHDDIINCGYNVIGVGHEHENDACLLSQLKSNSIWLCYNSITGDSGVTRLDNNYVRKLRIFEIDFADNRILSWKRKEVDKSTFDYQLIYQKDK
ncbi:Protein SIA1 [Candida viswanathii]|uniref:Protein SIA1 n=1 Tax=Candida viswanathii TaxID=5486 RepID=A0A367Y3C2_9ASCO|nr:Protein SIA1 [Candida viswanathii]